MTEDLCTLGNKLDFDLSMTMVPAAKSKRNSVRSWPQSETSMEMINSFSSVIGHSISIEHSNEDEYTPV